MIGLGLIVRAIVETLGVSSIAPFMSVVANPEVVQSNKWLRGAYEWGGFESGTTFLMALGAAVIVVLAVSNTISALSLWSMTPVHVGHEPPAGHAAVRKLPRPTLRRVRPGQQRLVQQEDPDRGCTSASAAS